MPPSATGKPGHRPLLQMDQDVARAEASHLLCLMSARHTTAGSRRTSFMGASRSPLGAIDTPKMIGEYLGSVVDVSADSFVVDSSAQVSNGDGLAFFSVSGELTGTVVNGSRRTRRGTEITPNSPERHCRWPGNLPQSRPRLRGGHPDQSPCTHNRRSVHFGGDFSGRLHLHAEDEDGNTAFAAVEGMRAPAQKPDQAEATARRQLARTGGTLYAVRALRSSGCSQSSSRCLSSMTCAVPLLLQSLPGCVRRTDPSD